MQLNVQTVLFLRIHINISPLHAHRLNVKQFYLTVSGATTPTQRGFEINGIVENSALPKVPALLELQHQIV